MSWQEPHPRRLPSLDEIVDNLVKIRRAENKIKELTFQIEELEKARMEVQRELDNRRSFLAPVRRLPSEIWGEIAAYCMEMDEGPKPWKLNQVSRSIRIAVNGMKSLWSTIWVKSMNSESKFDNAVRCPNLECLSMALERVSPAPLTIFLEERIEPPMLRELARYESDISKLILGDAKAKRHLLSGYYDALPDLKLTNLHTLVTTGGNAQDFPIFRFLDMANYSSRTDIALHFGVFNFKHVHKLMDHPILQRVVSLSVEIGKLFLPVARDFLTHLPIVQKPTNEAAILQRTIPQLQNLRIRGTVDLLSCNMPRLKVLDISHILIPRVYNGPTVHTRVHPHLLPTMLEELYIGHCNFTIHSEFPEPHRLARLKYLTLQDVNVREKPRIWFELPLLEELSLIKFDNYWWGNERGTLCGEGGMFGDLPSLKRLWAHGFGMEILYNFLSCPNLIALRLTECYRIDHLLGLVVNDSASVPQLEEFLLQSKLSVGVSIEDFIKQCSTRRPSLRVIKEKSQCRHQFRVETMESDK